MRKEPSIMNHHYPELATYLTIVLGYSLVVIIAIWFFIHFLRVGLNSADSRTIDKKPVNEIKAFATSSEGHHH
jgi:hypothetical protein